MAGPGHRPYVAGPARVSLRSPGVAVPGRASASARCRGGTAVRSRSAPVHVIVAGARTPMGRLLGGLKDFSGADLGGVAIKARAGAGRGHRRPGRLRDHGPGAAGRRRPDHRPPGRGQGRHPDGRAGADHQQGLPVRPRRHRAGRPADPRRRVRDRRRRRHGVDDQRPAPAAEVARGLQVRRRHDASTRWPTTGCSARSTRPAMGAARPRRYNAATRSSTREEQDAFSARVAPAGRRRRWKNGLFDDEIVAGGDPAAQGRPDRGLRGRGHPRRHHRRVAGRLRPAFSKDGTITAGSASQISDGAAAVVVMSRAKAEELGLDVARRDRRPRRRRRPGRDPAGAAGERDRARPASKEGITPADLDLVEINEAFAAVGIASTRDARHRRRQGQRQRRRDRARPPDRHVRRPARAAPGARAEASRRRPRRGRAVRRRRPGRRPDRPRPERLTGEPTPARRGASTTSSRGPARATPRAVARLISLVEDASPPLREVDGRRSRRTPATRRSSASPGRPASASRRRRRRWSRASARGGKRVGVLAVDPSSPFSGGALLGDRVRMQEHATDPERLHPVDGLPRAPRRAGLGDARRRCGCSTPPAATSSSSRPSASASPRSRSPGSPTPPSCCWRPGMGDGDPGRQGRHPRDRRRLRRQQGRPRRRRRDRARPPADARARRSAREPGAWRPPIVKTVASRGEGIDELVGRDRQAPRAGSETSGELRAAGDPARARRDRGDRGRPRCAARWATCTAARRSTTSRRRWPPGRPTRTPPQRHSSPRSEAQPAGSFIPCNTPFAGLPGQRNGVEDQQTACYM